MNEYHRTAEAAGNPAFLLVPGWISAIASIFVFPFVFGAAGVVFGIFASRSSTRAGVVLIWASLFCMAASFLKYVII